MNKTNTIDIFKNYTCEKLTENEIEEIETNIKEFYEILLGWTECNTT